MLEGSALHGGQACAGGGRAHGSGAFAAGPLLQRRAGRARNGALATGSAPFPAPRVVPFAGRAGRSFRASRWGGASGGFFFGEVSFECGGIEHVNHAHRRILRVRAAIRADGHRLNGRVLGGEVLALGLARHWFLPNSFAPHRR